jgi:4-carboxymuconolactone decarboxylase
MSKTVRFQETLRRLALIDEGFVESEAGLTLGPGGISALDPKTAALLQVGASVTIGSSAVCLQWSASRAMAAGASEDEIAEVLLAIAPVTGLGRIAAAAPDVAIALGYDVAAALEELDQTVLRRGRSEELAGRALHVVVPHHGHDIGRVDHGPPRLALQADQAVRPDLHGSQLLSLIRGEPDLPAPAESEENRS